MIIVRLMGGLGNQLFQYAFGRAFSLDHDIQVYFDISDYSHRDKNIKRDFELKKFPNINAKFIDSIFIRSAIRLKFIKKVTEEEYNNRLIVNQGQRPLFMSGYWQSLRFFEHIGDIIKKDLELPVLLGNTIYNKINETNSVSVHVRLSDYLSPPNVNIYKQLDEKYYISAINLIKEKIVSPSFFIFSDDIQKAKLIFNTIDAEVTYVNNNNNSLVDFELMKTCKHNIIANSTYSWWAAWLNKNINKLVIAPQKWFINSDRENIALSYWTKV